MDSDGAGMFQITIPRPDRAYAGVQFDVQAPDGVDITLVSHNQSSAIVMPPQLVDGMAQRTWSFSVTTFVNNMTSELVCSVYVSYGGTADVTIRIADILQYFMVGNRREDLVSDRVAAITLAPYGSEGVYPTPVPTPTPTPEPTPDVSPTPPADPTPTPPGGNGGGGTVAPPSGGGGGGGGGGGDVPTTTAGATPTPAPAETTAETPAPTPREIGEQETPLGISFLSDHVQFIFGYPDGTVRPDASITRAEAVTMIYRLIDDASKETPLGSSFSDVPRSEWYAHYVTYAASKGIVLGYPDGGFHPEDNITRAEFATIMSRFIPGASGGAPSFSDVGAGHWAVSYVGACAANGWIRGYPDGTFMPENSITRAESVAVLNRMLGRGIALESIPSSVPSYNDMGTNHWAYADVIEASVEHDFTMGADGKEIWR